MAKWCQKTVAAALRKNTVLMQRCNQVTASSVGKYITYSESSHSKLSWKVYHLLRINQSNSLGKSMLAKSYFKLLDLVPDPLALYLMLAQAWPHAPLPKWRPWERRISEEVSKPAGSQAFWMGRRGEKRKDTLVRRKGKQNVPFKVKSQSLKMPQLLLKEVTTRFLYLVSVGKIYIHSFNRQLGVVMWKHKKKKRNRKKKRAYNNKKRAAAALASGNPPVRKNVYETSGKDESRVLSLVQRDCQCASSNIFLFASSNMFPIIPFPISSITLRCFQDLLHPVRIQEQGPFDILGRVL